MNRSMRQKIAAFKRMAAPAEAASVKHTERVDSLAKVVRSRKDAEVLMADIETVVARARRRRA